MRGEYSWKLGCRGRRGGDSAQIEVNSDSDSARIEVNSGDNPDSCSAVKDKSTLLSIDTESRVVHNTSARYLTRKKEFYFIFNYLCQTKIVFLLHLFKLQNEDTHCASPGCPSLHHPGLGNFDAMEILVIVFLITRELEEKGQKGPKVAM